MKNKEPKKTNGPVGFSTGCLYRSKMPMSEIAELYHSCGANAIELSFATPAEFFNTEITKELISAAKKFDFISIHAPWKEINYSVSPETEKIIEKLKTIRAKLPIKGIVLHPHLIDDFEILKRSGLPFLLENTDKRKKFGICPEDFEELKKKCDFGFVLDLQHAFEHDPTMELAKKFIETMGVRLNHLHVSGESQGEIHVPAHLARNREAIVQMLELKLPQPKILEGIMINDIENTISKELNFINNYEK